MSLHSNAGVSSSIHPLDPVAAARKSELIRCVETNCCGTLLVTQALMPHLRLSPSPKVLFVGLDMGCVSQTVSNGKGWTSSVSYRASKAAEHMVMRCFHAEEASAAAAAAATLPRICFAAVHPGWVQTDMGGAGGRTADLGVGESAKDVLGLLGTMSFDTHGGRLFNHDGKEIQW